MKFNLIKKILFTILLFIIFLKFADIIFKKFTGLGNPLIYQHSKIFGYDIEPNQKVKRRGKVRRSKLYYLRELSGKAARIKEKLSTKK